MTKNVLSLIMPILLLASCNHVDPDTSNGPVLERSQVISTSTFHYSAIDPSVTRSLFIRYVHYFVRPDQWTVLSSGDTAPRTLFEEAAVYVLRFVGADNRPEAFRIFKVPNLLQTDGINPPRIHLVMRARGPAFSVRADRRKGLVFIEDGPVYGGFDVGGTLDPPNGDQTPRLLVDARVRFAALASDSETIAYVDAASQLFVVTPGSGPPELLHNLREALGPVTVKRIQWDYNTFNRLFIVVEQNGGERIWTTGTTRPSLSPVLQPPNQDFGQHGAGREDTIEALTRDFESSDWGIKNPEAFSP